VAADGAEWIWRQAAVQFPGAEGVLDLYHALEHVAATATTLFGEGTGTAEGWLATGRRRLVADGWAGLCRWVGDVRAACAEAGRGAAAIGATEELLGYFAKHAGRLDYAGRLAAGRTVGSGAVEGAIKQTVGKRLKQTGARWRLANAVRMATLCSTALAEDWDAYWTDASLSLAI
jgi:hypothetical protein